MLSLSFINGSKEYSYKNMAASIDKFQLQELSDQNNELKQDNGT
ncbi:hypothetical protein F383_18974 [Gossypium arboreum]|uniref:Uncharacterized protein n=1 Tax=Gossypium arboreum TaxID=29729 RepID=A0A0B0MH37_GOSAR|nr:hypothetical protein F383_18974 [Gossypium arboreum]